MTDKRSLSSIKQATSVRAWWLTHNLEQYLLPALGRVASLLDLAFIRIARSKPLSEYGGFHIDVDKGVGHIKTRNDNSDILRVLINLGSFPREVLYVRESIENLRTQGFDIPEDRYKSVVVPEHIQQAKIQIPALTKDMVSVLQFRSNKVLHMGKTYAEGHFLALYGGYIN